MACFGALFRNSYRTNVSFSLLFVCVHYFTKRPTQLFRRIQLTDFSLFSYWISGIKCDFLEIHIISSWLIFFSFCFIVKMLCKSSNITKRNSNTKIALYNWRLKLKISIINKLWWINCCSLTIHFKYVAWWVELSRKIE